MVPVLSAASRREQEAGTRSKSLTSTHHDPYVLTHENTAHIG